MWIDTHCHLAHGRLLLEVAAVLVRARAAGVGAFVCAAGDLDESRAALGLAHRHGDVYATAGVHPHDAASAPPDLDRRLRELAGDAKNIAVGEIGLDYHYDFSPRPAQQQAFAAQLDLAVRLGKPVVVHTREAWADTMAILRDSRVDGTRVIFHSFTEPPEHTADALDFGATISFSGIVTFAKSTALHETARLVPTGRLLIETDAPYLSPEPVRKQKTNEPAHVAHVGQFLAALRNVPAEEFARQTTETARRVFGV
ncbi:MAG: TatD family hydrolase [Phycisphaerae bacterium]|nr:TatD family hydrolase [Phycisphaerae bacterium]